MLPFLLMPRSAPGAALAGAIAPAHLLLVWNHPVAWAVTACEVPVVAILRRWIGTDLISADAIYWAVLAPAAAFLGYHFLSGFHAVPATLAALQGLGSFFSVSLACVTAMLVQLGRSRPGGLRAGCRRSRCAPRSAPSSRWWRSTGILILGVDARLYWRTLVEERVSGIVRVRERADAVLQRLHDDAQMMVQAMVAAAPTAARRPRSRPRRGALLTGIMVRDEAGQAIWQWTGERAPPDVGLSSVAVPVDRGGRRGIAVAAVDPGRSPSAWTGREPAAPPSSCATRPAGCRPTPRP